MKQPVMILFDDAIDYSPGQPTPLGAVLNTPIPQWMWITLGILAGVIVTLLVSTFLSTKPAEPVKVSPPATTRTASELLKSSLVHYGISTFTPNAKANPVSSTPTVPPRQVATSQQATTFSCHLSTTRAKVGETITNTLTTSTKGTVTAMWDDKIISGLQVSQATLTIA